MLEAASRRARVVVDGKFFRLGREKFFIRGVTYGPFPPDATGECFGASAQAARDFAQIRELGANVLRVYHVPPRWFLDLAAAHDLWLLVDVPWNKQACLDRHEALDQARRAVGGAALACASHPAVFAISVANEIPPEGVRWAGPARVEALLDELVGLVKEADPACLCTFGNFPSTEYLRSPAADFLCFNVYLHDPRTFRNYLARLQMLAEAKPVVIGELGFDSLREGAERQGELLRNEVESVFQGGCSGVCVYGFTDEWYKDGGLIEDWRFGLTTRDRSPKPAFAAVQDAFGLAPYYRDHTRPMVSVVVASYNGARTLRVCLESLDRLRYPAHEIILVDDGSTDNTDRIAAEFPRVRYLRHPENRGLSAARNTGIAAARGEVVAFTDADCRADEDWLHYLVSGLTSSAFVGIGGPNLLPDDDSSVAAAVLLSPGGPAPVMLTDRVAEHIPGCNMAFWKWALLEIGCFDPVFRRAGDDVDVCWRLQQAGYELGFSPAGFVWHYRRSTVREYLKQQHGYGEAEALLERKHPEYFNPLGGSVWRGRIYAPRAAGLRTRQPMIYHGLFGQGLFQSLYTTPAPISSTLLTSLEYYVLLILPLFVLAPLFRWLLPLGLAGLGIAVGVCVAAALQADIPVGKRRFWSRPLVAMLFALQPIVRGWARYQGRLLLPQQRLEAHENLDSLDREQRGDAPEELAYRTPPGFRRRVWLTRAGNHLQEAGWSYRVDSGWCDFDLEIYGGRWAKLQLTTVGALNAEGYPLFRVRLRPALTLPARAGIGILLGASMLVIGLGGRDWPWLWLLLLTLPAFVWWLSSQQRDLQRLLGVIVDGLAAESGLTKVAPDEPRNESKSPPA